MNILTKLWITLVFLTIFAFAIGWLKLLSDMIISLLLITTFLKGQIIIDYFMDLKNTQNKYRFIPTIWLFVILITIGMLFYL